MFETRNRCSARETALYRLVTSVCSRVRGQSNRHRPVAISQPGLKLASSCRNQTDRPASITLPCGLPNPHREVPARRRCLDHTSWSRRDSLPLSCFWLVRQDFPRDEYDDDVGNYLP